MKPHLNHIKHTMQRRQASSEAGNVDAALYKYKNMVAVAQEHGFTKAQIIAELEAERERVLTDTREGDAIFQQGLTNAKNACQKAIDQIIRELMDA